LTFDSTGDSHTDGEQISGAYSLAQSAGLLKKGRTANLAPLNTTGTTTITKPAIAIIARSNAQASFGAKVQMTQRRLTALTGAAKPK
jgi:hypothetical protein